MELRVVGKALHWFRGIDPYTKIHYTHHDFRCNENHNEKQQNFFLRGVPRLMNFIISSPLKKNKRTSCQVVFPFRLSEGALFFKYF
jgi:hypothetical protein